LRAAGHPIRHLDIGGGLGVPYRSGNDVPPRRRNTPESCARRWAAWASHLPRARPHDRRQRRRAGFARDLRQARARQDLHHRRCRHERPDPPTLYEAHHEIWPVDEALARKEPILQDVAGPVCETGDYLALDRKLLPSPPATSRLHDAGAYGSAMSSTYNSRLLVPEVLVKGDEFAVVRPRQSYADLIGLDRVPDWLA
jgi:diaminopimelate decarboxylase